MNSVTPTVRRKNGGMPKWALLSITFADGKLQFFWPYVSEIGGRRFLTRFILIPSHAPDLWNPDGIIS